MMKIPPGPVCTPSLRTAALQPGKVKQGRKDLNPPASLPLFSITTREEVNQDTSTSTQSPQALMAYSTPTSATSTVWLFSSSKKTISYSLRDLVLLITRRKKGPSTHCCCTCRCQLSQGSPSPHSALGLLKRQESQSPPLSTLTPPCLEELWGVWGWLHRHLLEESPSQTFRDPTW